jgi:hypothetical protein
MNAKNGRLNTDFQIVNFLIGSCHTPDGAYALLCDLRDDRLKAVNNAPSSMMKARARIMRLKLKRLSPLPWHRLEANAELRTIEEMRPFDEKVYNAALEELKTLTKCMERLEPLRKFGHLPLAQAHAAAQEEEWKLELLHRAENFLFCTGSLPPDHFATMRMHPAFSSEILPHVTKLLEARKTGKLLPTPQRPAFVLALEAK